MSALAFAGQPAGGNVAGMGRYHANTEDPHLLRASSESLSFGSGLAKPISLGYEPSRMAGLLDLIDKSDDSVMSEVDIAAIIASHIQMREHYEPFLATHGYYLPPLDLRDDDPGPPMIPNHCDGGVLIPL